MSRKRLMVMMLVLSVTAALLVGCGKKRAETMPPGATKVEVVEEPVDWGEQPAQQGPTEEELRAQRKAKAVQDLTTMIFFAFDSNELTPESRDILQSKAEILKSYRDLTMVIEGYCDERGTVEYNLALGERRARAAYDYLVILGVAPDRLSIVSFGEENPLDSGRSEQAWAKNRRDQFRVFQ
ncbi:peptidoglycan-associated lipoprotein [Paucidesulfovibrio gracilis DSM 16080]|uniref:Peptidoglycan-associated lipoprotein n=1 Tax=Paucidesulfovibrio gracilis DSM 16080 TaxID=1121449 RepID=A0A1T4WK08_9BACT|nr:peptidoglycan-associated lipoprotein Pal [Paucidesulfovibrio gracilis]SKA77660.1 peptidoglycan-associated lipoprotein [Paucidesulfovibrio gracilis DSM 16080]